MPAGNGVFHVVRAEHLDAARDLLVGLPVEGNNKQAFHRVPLRSACLETEDDRRLRVQTLPGSPNVVQSTQGLRRLLIQFPRSYTPRGPWR